MNYRKMIAAAAAVCVIASCAAVDCRNFENTTGAVHAEDQFRGNAITLNYIGDSVPITFTGAVKITWYSEDESIATVTPTSDLSANVTATGKGSTAVYAVLPDELIRFDVTVLNESKVEVNTVSVGSVTLTNQQKSAEVKLTGITAGDAVWTSSDPDVAAVDGSGVITAVGRGSCVITAQYGNTNYIINVTSEYEEAEKPTEKAPQFLGKVELSDKITTQQITGITPDIPVTLSSTDETVATVSAAGLITAVGAGSCRIYIESNGTTGYFEVVSTYTGNPQTNTDMGEICLDAATPSRKISISGIPDEAEVSWSSSDSSIAIATRRGSVIAVGDGECIVTAKVDGVEYTASVKVENTGNIQTTEIKGVGRELEFSTGLSGNVEFFSTDESVLTIDGSGRITAVGTGTAAVIAESDTGLSYMRFSVVPSRFYGDANCDGTVDIADATFILQSIGNGDKYVLSEQGQLNADVDGSPGVTALDSLVIQMFDAKIINALPADPADLG
ncbi:MAG: dockerin type I domain-containing protein [Alistipes sp.]|nr:dockerin type I domain-containing protein [Alistipes sp.]